MKFEEYIELSEQPSGYSLNDQGIELVNSYLSLVNQLKKWVGDDVVVSLLASISATNNCKPIFKIAKDLANLTNDGRDIIDSNNFVINPEDERMAYLNKV